MARVCCRGGGGGEPRRIETERVGFQATGNHVGGLCGAKQGEVVFEGVFLVGGETRRAGPGAVIFIFRGVITVRGGRPRPLPALPFAGRTKKKKKGKGKKERKKDGQGGKWEGGERKARKGGGREKNWGPPNQSGTTTPNLGALWPLLPRRGPVLDRGPRAPGKRGTEEFCLAGHGPGHPMGVVQTWRWGEPGGGTFLTLFNRGAGGLGRLSPANLRTRPPGSKQGWAAGAGGGPGVSEWPSTLKNI